MKCVLMSLVILGSITASAQQNKEIEQTGTPAVMEVANGKKVKVMLQRVEGDRLIFQPYKQLRDMPAPMDKLAQLTFFPKFDPKAVEEMFTAGDFQGVIDTVGSDMEEFVPYMPVPNNLRSTFVLVYHSYKSLEDYESAARYAQQLLAMEDVKMKLLGQVGMAQIALAQGDLVLAEKIRSELPKDAEAASLYIQAAIERANGEPKQAIQTVTRIIENHPNDVEILPASELLVAYCYLDMTGTNSVITTNSAMNTARQVKNMYAGTAVAVNAEKLWAELGGREVEARELAIKAEMEEAEQAAEKKKAEQMARRKAEKAAVQAEAANTDVSATTETKTESE
ncbi:tetratricopeptide repeat protein [Verrucomicrobia bacterium S94]|nr:tetratricopeptide repeat protein [Verrucomicrobia bacterium S94]